MCLFLVTICLSQVQLLYVRLQKGVETLGEGTLFLHTTLIIIVAFVSPYCLDLRSAIGR